MMILGTIGTVACVAAIVGSWYVAGRVQRVNSNVFKQADQLMVQIDDRAVQAGSAVHGTRELVEELKKTIRKSTEEFVAKQVLSLSENENLERRIASTMERADRLIEVSTSSAELLVQLFATIGTLAPEPSADARVSSDLLMALRSTNEMIAEALERLTEVQRRLEEIQQNREVDVNLAEIGKITLGIVTRLDVVQERIAVFRGRIAEMRQQCDKTHEKIAASIFAAQCLAVLVLLWIGVGQYCLLVQGWRILWPLPPTRR